MVIVKVSGGLGNQMFEYSFAKWLQQNGDKDVRLDISQYGKQSSGGADLIHNGFELERLFFVDIPYATYAEACRYGDIENSFVRKVLRKLSIFKDTHIKRQRWGGGKWFFPQTAQMDDVYFDGYWCTYEYAQQIEQVIRQSFRFKPILQAQNQKVAEAIQKSESVSIHVRRGDYLKLQDMYLLLNGDYYRRAIDSIEKRVSNPTYFVFSDDIEWCKANLWADRITYVDWNRGSDSFIDMQLMSMCKHHIIANSTFSMWAAWLNSNPSKIVICPERVFVDAIHMPSDMYPESWEVLSN